MRLTRVYRFSAAHRLHAPALSEEQNRSLFGKCNNPYGHGHNYRLEVTVAGRVDASTGRLVRIEELDRLVNSTVVDSLDHANLNSDVPGLSQVVPTTENLALFIDRRLREVWHWNTPSLERVRIRETRNNYFETGRNRT